MSAALLTLDDVAARLKLTGRNPARTVKRIVQAFFAHLNGDSEAQMVLMGWSEGLRGEQLRAATGLDQAALDYAGKRIRRRLRKAYPNGWTP